MASEKLYQSYGGSFVFIVFSAEIFARRAGRTAFFTFVFTRMLIIGYNNFAGFFVSVENSREFIKFSRKAG